MGTKVDFNYTGAEQQWVVPAGVTQVIVEATGAQGGGTSGGKGGYVKSILGVTPGETLYIYVGGQGTQTAAGYNGGGAPIAVDTGTYPTAKRGFGGGGRSDVRQGGNSWATNKVAVGAGGGGQGAPRESSAYANPGVGGAGGHTGANGGWNGGGTDRGGKGATQLANGSTNSYVSNPDDTAGSNGTGGQGGFRTDGGTGGGGAQFGGGASGGASAFDGGAGGGGGSNYVDLAVSTSLTSNTSTRSGNGIVSITYNDAPTVDVTAPTGNITEARPTVEWNYTDTDNDVQASYRVKVFTEAQYTAAGFDPATSATHWDSAKIFSSASSKQITQDLINNTTYRAYVQVTDPDTGLGNHTSTWDYTEFTIANTAPVVNITAPTGTIANTSSPTATWTYTDTESNVQSHYQLIVEVGDGTAGSNPGGSLAQLPTGWVAGTDTSRVLDAQPNGTYTLWVKARHTFGQESYVESSWDKQLYTINIPPPPTPTVTTAFDSNTGLVTVTASNTGGAPVTEEFDIEVKVDGVWITLVEGVAADGNQEYSLSNGDWLPHTATEYRARARYYDATSGEPYTSVWATGNILVQPEDWWLIDRDDESNNMEISVVGTTMDIDKPRDGAVFNPIGRKNQVVITDVQRSEKLPITVETLGPEEKAAFETFLETSVGHDLILKSPSVNTEQWYCQLSGNPKKQVQNIVDPWIYYEVEFTETGR